jgi:phosphatidylserine/phosphatidylglycerophosphate/cardiolipin synthase-like enzyme
MIRNNQINLLQNGEAYFPAIEAALDRAMHEIYLETYIFENDTTGQRIAEALRRAALRGVKTHVLMDGFGSLGLLGIRFKCIRKYRYNALCPFHADAKESFMVNVNKDDQVRFHCFGACKGDWDIYDVIMLRNKDRFSKAQQVWAEHLGVVDFRLDDGRSP